MIQYLRELHFASVVVRLALAMLLGGCIGLERGRKRRPAGFRTYMLVCLGAALTVLLSLYEFSMVTGPLMTCAPKRETSVFMPISAQISDHGPVTMVNSYRLSSTVINGIGFLGAGTILVTGRQQVKGLTTAAGLWASACTGLAVGAGFYECVLIAFAMIFLSIRLFPIVDAYIQENARDINLYMEFYSLGDISTIINQRGDGRADADEDVRAEAGRLALVRALDTDNAAADERAGQTHEHGKRRHVAQAVKNR